MTHVTRSALSMMSCRKEFANAIGMKHHWMAMHRGVDTEPFRAPADGDPSSQILDLQADLLVQASRRAFIQPRQQSGNTKSEVKHTYREGHKEVHKTYPSLCSLQYQKQMFCADYDPRTSEKRGLFPLPPEHNGTNSTLPQLYISSSAR
jgi:hypothetical protein